MQFDAVFESKLTDIAADYTNIHKSSIGKSYLARDLLRLYKKFTIYDRETRINFEKTDNLPHLFNQLSILLNIRECNHAVDEPTSENPIGLYKDENSGCIQITEELYKEVVPSEQMHQSLTLFLDRYFGDDNILVKLLKCVDQAYVVALLGNLAESLFFSKQPMRFKDVQGSWHITIRKNEDNFSFIHHRTEQMLKQINNVMLAETFKFQWELELVSDSLDFNYIKTMHVRLKNIDWSTLSDKIQWSDEEKQNHENEFRRLFGSSDHLTVDNVHEQVRKNKASKEDMIEQRKQAIKEAEASRQQQQQQSVENGFSCNIL